MGSREFTRGILYKSIESHVKDQEAFTNGTTYQHGPLKLFIVISISLRFKNHVVKAPLGFPLRSLTSFCADSGGIIFYLWRGTIKWHMVLSVRSAAKLRRVICHRPVGIIKRNNSLVSVDLLKQSHTDEGFRSHCSSNQTNPLPPPMTTTTTTMFIGLAMTKYI